MDHPTSPPKMPVTIAPPPGAMVCYGVAADAHLHTPMKKSRSDERLSGVDLQEARAQFHQMLSRERPDLNNRDKGRIVRSTINHKTAVLSCSCPRRTCRSRANRRPSPPASRLAQMSWRTPSRPLAPAPSSCRARTIASWPRRGERARCHRRAHRPWFQHIDKRFVAELAALAHRRLVRLAHSGLVVARHVRVLLDVERDLRTELVVLGLDLGEGGSKNEKMKETVIPPTTKDPPALGPSPFNSREIHTPRGRRRARDRCGKNDHKMPPPEALRRCRRSD